MIQFPTIIITTDNSLKLINDYHCVQYNHFVIYIKKNIINYYYSNNNDFIIITHANYSFLKRIKDFKTCDLLNSNTIFEDLSWGVFIMLNKKDNTLIVKNDIYGIYPFYIYNNNENIFLSNNFNYLVELAKELTIDNLSIIDILLYNYPLQNRTVFKEISRIRAFSTITLKDSKVHLKQDGLIDIIFTTKSKRNKIDKSIFAINSVLIHDQIPNIENQFALTGGFDSKILLSSLLSLDINFSAFTWGSKNSADYVSAEETCKILELKHKNIEQNSLNNYPIEYLKRLLDYQPNFPVADTLLNYILVNDYLKPSNIFTGIMGGELIVGPIIKAELILTRYAYFLTSTNDINEYKLKVLSDSKINSIINDSILEKKIDLYYNLLEEYSFKKDSAKNSNVIKFLLIEAYPKFFGTVLNIFLNKHNLITPLVNLDHLKYLLNSKYSFTRKKAFCNNPLIHFSSRRFYAKYVKLVYPKVLKTPMDRRYNLGHFKNFLTMIIPSINYIERHFFKNKQIKSMDKEYINKLVNHTQEIINDSPVNNIVLIDINKTNKYLKEYRRGYRNNRLTQNILQILLLHTLLNKYKHKKINYENH